MAGSLILIDPQTYESFDNLCLAKTLKELKMVSNKVLRAKTVEELPDKPSEVKKEEKKSTSVKDID